MSERLDPYSFRPTADLATLRLRARLLAVVRRFFDSRDYWEVETPQLSQDSVVDAHLDPFVVPAGFQGRDLYLQTSPEFAMKRLLAAGAEAIYQIVHVFRRGERGRLHNPEFTMIEWYRTGATHFDQMRVVEALVREVFSAAAPEAERTVTSDTGETSGTPAAGAASGRDWGSQFPRTTYAEAFEKHLGIDVLTIGTSDLAALAREQGISIPPGLEADDRDGWLNLLLAERIEPLLGQEIPEYLHEYPVSQGALACASVGNPLVADRFELYYRGIELCNGYRELTDPAELRARIDEQLRIRAREGLPPLPRESRLLAAMEAGLPESSGVALGFDRLVMFAAGKSSIDEVIPFPIERA